MKVKIKKLVENAVIPSYSKPGDAGMDLTITSIEHIDTEHIKYGFGLAFEIPPGYVGKIYPRSSCYKQRQILSNCVGILDSGYRGEVGAIFIGTNFDYRYKIGERCAQIIIEPIPTIEFEVVDELSKTDRGSGGYGSTGK